MRKLKIKIYGKVQGVFFRVFVKKEAEKRNLVGWVKNESDGTVTAEVEGEKGKLKELISQCKKGSPLSKVEKMDIDFSDEIDGYREFVVLS